MNQNWSSCFSLVFPTIQPISCWSGHRWHARQCKINMNRNDRMWNAGTHIYVTVIFSSSCRYNFLIPCKSIRHFQNWRLGSRRKTVGTPKEPTCHELRQAEPLHTSVLQEGHHPQAWRVTEAGVPVRSPSVRLWEEEEEGEPTKHIILPSRTLTPKPKMKGVMGHVHWPTPVINTSSSSSGAAAAWRLFCTRTQRRSQNSVHVGAAFFFFYIFLLQNETGD